MPQYISKSPHFFPASERLTHSSRYGENARRPRSIYNITRTSQKQSIKYPNDRNLMIFSTHPTPPRAEGSSTKLHESLKSERESWAKHLNNSEENLGVSQRGGRRTERVTNSGLGPLLPLQSIEMKDATAQKAAKMANDDLDAYLASVQAYLARPDSRLSDPILPQRSKSKSSKQRHNENAMTEPRTSSVTTKELAKKHCTQKSS